MIRPSRVPRHAAWAVAAAVTVLATAAQPGPVGIPWLGAHGSGPLLTQDDVVRMQAAIARLNEGRSIGSVERWRSESSKDAGEVSLTRRFIAKGMTCHTIHSLIRFQSQPSTPRTFVFNWCRQRDGAWKIVELDD